MEIWHLDLGTCYATPIVAGMAAQMMQYDPTLKTRARAVKAILSACCDRKVPGGSVETMEQGLTPEQGAGVVNAVNMYEILVDGSYTSGSFTNTASYSQSIYIGGTFNVSANWIRPNWVSNHTSGEVDTFAYQNCDLYLYAPNGEQMASLQGMSSTEMIYRTGKQEGYYTVQLHKRDENTSKTVWFGLAWLK